MRPVPVPRIALDSEARCRRRMLCVTCEGTAVGVLKKLTTSITSAFTFFTGWIIFPPNRHRAVRYISVPLTCQLINNIISF
jgi:hypothetical protein